MLVADDEETGEKARTLRRKVLNNIVAAKLRNEREKEKLSKKLNHLAKQEEYNLRKMQRSLTSVRRELVQSTRSLERGKNKVALFSKRTEKPLPPCDHETKNDDTSEAESEINPKPFRRRFSELSLSTKVPMSFLELKRLPPLQKTTTGMIEWPLAYEREKRLEFPPLKALLKNRRKSTTVLPRIVRPAAVGSDSGAPRRNRFMSSPAVLENFRSVSEESLSTIASEHEEP